MIGEAGRLVNHCRVHHADSNKGFLKFDEMPPFPIYLNFESYLKGHADTLVGDSELKKNKSGRKRNNA